MFNTIFEKLNMRYDNLYQGGNLAAFLNVAIPVLNYLLIAALSLLGTSLYFEDKINTLIPPAELTSAVGISATFMFLLKNSFVQKSKYIKRLTELSEQDFQFGLLVRFVPALYYLLAYLYYDFSAYNFVFIRTLLKFAFVV